MDLYCDAAKILGIWMTYIISKFCHLYCQNSFPAQECCTTTEDPSSQSLEALLKLYYSSLEEILKSETLMKLS